MNAIDPIRQPVVFSKSGEVYASSRAVSEMFGKRHDNVLRDIGAIEISSDLRGCWFSATSVLDAHGRSQPAFDMTRDGFTLLAMGWNGAKAMAFKVGYLKAFNLMEAKLREPARDPMEMLADPAAMRGLLLGYTEKVLLLQAEVAAMTPSVEGFARLAVSDGSMCITDAAKTLQTKPKVLFLYLRGNGWIYTRPGGSAEIAYQDKIASGLLEHKTTSVHRSDGSEKTVTQVRVTPKGLTKLALLLGVREASPADQLAFDQPPMH